MKYRSLGRTGVQVSELGLGTSVLVRESGEEAGLRIIRRALEAGINFIDTANVYGRGAAERLVGRAIAEHGRERVIVATKMHGRMDRDDPNARGSHRRHIIEACEDSLSRLGTDWIDLYQFHRPEPATPIDEPLRALDDLIRQGKVRYIGTSVYAAWQLVESLWVAKELGLNRFVSEQPPYHLLDRRIEREVVPMARTHGFGLITWSPLAGGMLSGKYRRDNPEAGGGRLTREQWPGMFGNHFRQQAFDVADRVRDLAAEKGCTPSQLAVAWVMRQPGVTCPLLGCRTLEHLEDNLGALDATITDEDRARLDEVAPPGDVIMPYHQGDWGPHPYRW